MRELLYDVTHVTHYEYQGAVSVAHHLLHLEPRRQQRQRCLEFTLDIDPAPALQTTHGDYFGNTATFLTIEGAHRRLSLTARSRVAIRPPFLPDPAETPAWDAVRHMCRSDYSPRVVEASEFIFPSPLVPADPAFASYAAPSFPAGRPLLEAVLDLTRRIHQDFTFDTRATEVATPIATAFQQRRGVCQDFAHIQIACLRSVGLPARYVSGYLETDPPPGVAKLRGVDASHAWIACFCPGLGWIDLDPTNNLLPSLRHVTIAWGRDYGDVCPARGVLLGGGEQSLSVSVDVVALGSSTPPGKVEPVSSLKDQP
jgi:transglutaminase-like putative cysteine protease